jgi:hypothetical protein
MSSDLFRFLLKCDHRELREFLALLPGKPFNSNTVVDLVRIIDKFPEKIPTDRVMKSFSLMLKGSCASKIDWMIALALSTDLEWERAIWKSFEKAGLDSEYLRPQTALPSSLPPALPSSLPPALPSSLPPALPSSLPPALPSTLPPALPSTLPPALPSSLPPALLVDQGAFARALLDLLNWIPGSYAIKIDVVREWLREVLRNAETYRVPDLEISAWHATLRAYVFGDGILPPIPNWSVSKAERVFVAVRRFRALRDSIAMNANCSANDLFVFSALGMRLLREEYAMTL